jgi:hypothetical protein
MLREQKPKEMPARIRVLLGTVIVAHGLLTGIAISAGILYAGIQALPQA